MAKHPELFIQGLSGGQPSDSVETTFVDDFTGERKPLSAKLVNNRREQAMYVRQRSDLLYAARESAAAKALRMHNERLALASKMFCEPKLVTPAKPGQQVIPLTGDLIIRVPPKSWRRF